MAASKISLAYFSFLCQAICSNEAKGAPSYATTSSLPQTPAKAGTRQPLDFGMTWKHKLTYYFLKKYKVPL